MHGRIYYPGMGSYPPRVALALRTPSGGFHTVGAVSTWGTTVFVPGLLERCRCMEGVLVWEWGLFLPGWRWLYEFQVGVSTPWESVSTRGTTVFVPGLLDLWMYGRASDPGMSLILPGWCWLYEPLDGFSKQPVKLGLPHSAGWYRPGRPPFS